MSRRAAGGPDHGRDRRGGQPGLVGLATATGLRADSDLLRGHRVVIPGGRDSRLCAVAGQSAGPAVHHRRLPVPAAVHPGQPGESGRVHAREPDPGYLHRRRGSPGSGLAHRAAPVEVRVRRGHLRLRADHRLQRCRDDVLESRLQRLHHRMPGQRAARRRRLPVRLGHPQHGKRLRRPYHHRDRADPDRPPLAVGARLVPAGHGPSGVARLRGRDRADRDRRCPQPAPFKPGQLRASPAGNAGRPGSVRDQHGAGADSGRRARHRDRGPGTGSLAGPAPGGACPGTGRLDAAARVPATGWVRLSRHREPGRRRGPGPVPGGSWRGWRARTRPSWSTTRAWRSSRSWSS